MPGQPINPKHKVNFGIFFKEVLTGLGAQEDFKKDIKTITNHLWESLCTGRANNRIKFGEIAEKTHININILRGEKQMLLYKNSEDDYCESMEESVLRQKIQSFIIQVKNNNYTMPDEAKDTYNSEFLTLVAYAIFLKRKDINSAEHRVNQCRDIMRSLKSSDYKEIKPELLEIYLNTLERHISAIKAIQLIRNFDETKYL
ncbi:hypothetical protein N4T77_15715 [Clostridium sp. CX1]|uniref:hypothetical protein n=1 Tax=Clostridium sp. CX1 TaxID=2978346 RepID=UPI0021BEA7B6|nr:hypothetical protein [Clostridium sp. CX1]MCT8978040.1 hypothetical protein [Clostridium sp. CX1]